MKGGEKIWIEGKALHLVCSKDAKGQDWLQNFHTGKLGR